MTIHERIIKPKINNQGYYYISLRINKETHDYLIHRLVAITFLPNPDNLPCVNHKDCNPRNNSVSNLEWCTISYNNAYSFQHGKAPIGGNCIDMYDKNMHYQRTFATQADASLYVIGNKTLAAILDLHAEKISFGMVIIGDILPIYKV